MRTLFSVNLGIDAVQKRSFDFSFPSLLQPLIASDIPLGADQARPGQAIFSLASGRSQFLHSGSVWCLGGAETDE
jgi:hypothetical protein